MTDRAGPFDDLPGDLMVWVLIVSELLVFGAGVLASCMKCGVLGFLLGGDHVSSTRRSAPRLLRCRS